MKIIHVISSAASGGAEIYVKDLSKAMVLNGNDVLIVFLDRASESGRDADFESSFLSELDKNGIEYGFLGSSSRINPVKGALGLARLCRKFSPNVIHSHLYFGAIFSLFQFGVPHVYTHHNIKLKASPYLYRILDLRTTAYVGICNACETLLKGVTRKPVVRIDNGVDESRVNPKKTFSLDLPLKIICVGTLSLQKNHQLLLHAISKLPDLDILLTVAGEGSQAHQLKCLVKELGIERKVDFIGNSNNIKQLMHDADIFVMSSAWEGLPIVQIEATLTGLPVLVTDVGGCSEIVDRVGNGLVAKVELEDYTEKLEKLIVDGELRATFHKNALQNGGHYTIDNAVNSHLVLYDHLTRQLAHHA
ncbi:glycosyltransferase [Halomonas sp. LR5S13]|uniref:glycosyltransferase n=1 Tax=Halomonas rhizosphaerae TaxID=3043296 RepID=UPI0024A97588|nr:glycosyltransferase [Halomonas rhizosphaerae]MDI5921859.1 glycosyltransferase [Halomonas rhizosphaerae]